MFPSGFLEPPVIFFIIFKNFFVHRLLNFLVFGYASFVDFIKTIKESNCGRKTRHIVCLSDATA